MFVDSAYVLMCMYIHKYVLAVHICIHIHTMCVCMTYVCMYVRMYACMHVGDT